MLPPASIAGACTRASAETTPNPCNRLLAALSPGDRARLLPLLGVVELPAHQILQSPGAPLSAVCFPEAGCVSMLASIEDGGAAEVGLTGRAGMVGLPLLLDGDQDDLEGMVQAAGTALRMDPAAFRGALDRVPARRRLLLRFALVHHAQVSRTAACNGRHPLRPGPHRGYRSPRPRERHLRVLRDGAMSPGLALGTPGQAQQACHR